MPTCPYCAEPIRPRTEFCPHCDADLFEEPPPRRRQQQRGRRRPSNAAERMLLPVDRSIWAIAAGYLGLISVLVFPAPIALVVSIVAFMQLRDHPELHGMGRVIFGLIMGTIFSIGLVIGLLAFFLNK